MIRRLKRLTLIAGCVAVAVCASAGASVRAAPVLGHITVVSTAESDKVFLVAANGSGWRKISFPSAVFSGKADLSDDGKAIVAATITGVYVVPVSQDRPRKVPNVPTSSRSSVYWTVWSPGGSQGQIAMSFNAGLWTMFVNGNGRRRLAMDAEQPDWSPDNTQIAFVRDLSDSTGLGRIYAIGTDGRDLHFLVRGAQPAFSPDGEKLAFIGRAGIYVMPVEGGNPRLVLRNGAYPSWSPDGKRIAFIRPTKCGHAGCVGRIFIAPAVGGSARAIGPEIFDIGPISWSR